MSTVAILSEGKGATQGWEVALQQWVGQILQVESHPAESMRAALYADARRPSSLRHSGGLRYTLA